MKKNINGILMIGIVSLICVIICGCSPKNEATDNLTNLDFVVYTGESTNSWQAHEVKVNTTMADITMNPQIMFEITDEHGWSDNLFPIEMTDELLVLRTESTVETDRKTIISKREEYLGEYTIWNGNMSLVYDPQKCFAELKEDDETIGRIIDLTYEEISLYPIAFFVDEEDKIVLLCERGNEETEWAESYPVAVIASQDESEGGQYRIEKTQKFEHMFSDALSAVNAPYRSWFSKNTYPDDGLKCFLWNEGKNIVKMDPYSGKYETVLTEEQATEVMPFLDVQRESYEFFSDFSIQGNTYIAIFPAYNDLNGTYAAMFDRKGVFVGAILCTESEIRYIDQAGEEKASVCDEKLKGLLYAPMG